MTKIQRIFKKYKKLVYIFTIGLNLFTLWLVIYLITHWKTLNLWLFIGLLLLIAGLRIGLAWDQFDMVTKIGADSLRIRKQFKVQAKKGGKE